MHSMLLITGKYSLGEDEFEVEDGTMTNLKGPMTRVP